MNPFSHKPIFSKLAFYLKANSLFQLVKTCKDIYHIGMMPNYKAKLYHFDVSKQCENGDLPVIIWLHNNNYPFRKSAMNFAADKGHLEVVQWLHENRKEGCNKSAMNFAAENGHLEVVKWLHENRTEGCTKNAMDWAAYGGYLDVVQWLHQNRKEGCTKDA
ncbi:MAG: ankyrin repeat domain-containing protein, partial [Candidatus Paceibacterota bacterium]